MAETVCTNNHCITHAQLAVILKFFVGGIIVLYFYWRIYNEIFKNKSNTEAMTPEKTWGYLKRFESVWFPLTLITTLSVIYVFIWLSFIHTDSEYNHQEFVAFVVVGTFIFMTGAIQWPIHVLKNRPIILRKILSRPKFLSVVWYIRSLLFTCYL